jgi:hypothetical protein
MRYKMIYTRQRSIICRRDAFREIYAYKESWYKSRAVGYRYGVYSGNFRACAVKCFVGDGFYGVKVLARGQFGNYASIFSVTVYLGSHHGA